MRVHVETVGSQRCRSAATGSGVGFTLVHIARTPAAVQFTFRMISDHRLKLHRPCACAYTVLDQAFR